MAIHGGRVIGIPHNRGKAEIVKYPVGSGLMLLGQGTLGKERASSPFVFFMIAYLYACSTSSLPIPFCFEHMTSMYMYFALIPRSGGNLPSFTVPAFWPSK